MKRDVLLLSMLSLVSWTSTSWAQRQTAVGPLVIPLSPTGSLNGVDMSASSIAGTLSVGVVGGPQTDIFSSNSSLTPGFVAVSTAANSQGNITFNSSSNVYGAIGATQPAGPFLLGISGGNVGTAVNFLGPVYATTTNVTGTGAINFLSGSTNITATNFAADGTISLAPNTTLIGALTTTAGANTGTLSLGNASVLNGAVGGAVGLRSINVVGGTNAAGATASITGAADAYAFSLGTSTLNVGGALTIANGGAGGVINTTLASPTVFGNIRPVGATNLGPTLLINTTVPSTAFIPLGTQFNIVQTQTGTLQSGTNGSVVSVSVQNPTNPLYTFSAVPAAGTIAGLVTIRTTGIPILVPITPPAGVILPPSVGVAAPIVPVLLAVAPTVATTTTPTTATPTAPSPDIVNVLAPLDAIASPVVVVNAIAQLAPSTATLAAPLVAFQRVGQFENLWLSHVDDSLCREVSALKRETTACDGEKQRSGWWLKGFGYVGDQGEQGAYAGYNSAIGGGMVGVDASITPATRLGFGIGYAGTTIDGKNFGGAPTSNVTTNSYQATAYIAHEAGPWFVNGDLSFGWDDNTENRNIAFPGLAREASAHFSGQDYSAYAVTGYHARAGSFTITPSASLQYTHTNLASYTEGGAGDINLRVGGRGDDFLESSIGLKVARPFYGAASTLTYVPDLHTKWLHELANPSMVQSAAFTAAGSPSFTTLGGRQGADTFNVGAGISVLTCSCSAETWSIEVVYDYYRRTDNYSANQGMLKFTRRF
ncbi:MAG: autotransporter domain-containing protein [Proteobacteria bacterium]|nr:autotransporter domain-containing protein [Pseudomonadota bacterium]